MSQDVPSPTKRATRAPASAAERDPTDPRGSLNVATGFEDLIRQRAMAARAGVNWGHATSSSGLPAALPRRRPLGFSRTEPSLSFASTSTPAPVASWQSGKDILDEVYAHAALTGKRSDELRPMWETGSATDTAASAHSAGGNGGASTRQDSGFFGASGAGHPATVGALSDDGDGFDLDEAFGHAGAARFGFAAGGAVDAVQEDSQDSSRTVTQRLKRAYDDSDAAAEEQLAEDDEAMDATDIEDEGDDDVVGEPMSMFGTANAAAGPRRLAGLKRGFHKTQSLPPSAFAGKMEF
ncbi:hypothetical protein JCM10908_004166 [Rhodotorula pacifica]|uniref:uncharacterized protein n=1 Tax=Rhodotorula pacifica TaxID=1495444 RepID=UPI00316E4AC5